MVPKFQTSKDKFQTNSKSQFTNLQINSNRKMPKEQLILRLDFEICLEFGLLGFGFSRHAAGIMEPGTAGPLLPWASWLA
jgi:hypothetical protein